MVKSIFSKICAAGSLLFVFAGALTTPAMANDTASSSSEAVVLDPLSILKDKDLNFGLILPGSSQGFVTLAPEDSSVTSTGGVLALAGQTQAATFYGYGTYRQFLRLSVSANTYQLQRDGGSETMQLDRLLISSSPETQLTSNPKLFYIGSRNGFFSFSLGGRLRVNANQTPGVYIGEIDVRIEYL